MICPAAGPLVAYNYITITSAWANQAALPAQILAKCDVLMTDGAPKFAVRVIQFASRYVKYVLKSTSRGSRLLESLGGSGDRLSVL